MKTTHAMFARLNPSLPPRFTAPVGRTQLLVAGWAATQTLQSLAMRAIDLCRSAMEGFDKSAAKYAEERGCARFGSGRPAAQDCGGRILNGVRRIAAALVADDSPDKETARRLWATAHPQVVAAAEEAVRFWSASAHLRDVSDVLSGTEDKFREAIPAGSVECRVLLSRYHSYLECGGRVCGRTYTASGGGELQESWWDKLPPVGARTGWGEASGSVSGDEVPVTVHIPKTDVEEIFASGFAREAYLAHVPYWGGVNDRRLGTSEAKDIPTVLMRASEALHQRDLALQVQEAKKNVERAMVARDESWTAFDAAANKISWVASPE